MLAGGSDRVPPKLFIRRQTCAPGTGRDDGDGTGWRGRLDGAARASKQMARLRKANRAIMTVADRPRATPAASRNLIRKPADINGGDDRD